MRKAHRILSANEDDINQKQLHIEVINKLCTVLMRDKGLDEALMLAKKALTISKDDPDIYIMLGKIQDRKGLNQEAIDSFTQALKLQNSQSPPKPGLFFHIACCQERLKDFKKAVLNYKKCLTLDAKHFGASLHLANLLANVGEGQRAAKYFKHALKISTETNVSQDLIVNA